MAYKLLIDGQLVDGARSLEVLNPATEAVLAMAPCADESQLNRAIAAAKSAFPEWSTQSFAYRRAKIETIAEAMERRVDEFARLLTLEQGKPLTQSLIEVRRAVLGLRSFATMETKLTLLREDDSVRIIQQRTPLGVVAAIMPWNFPMSLMIMKVGPALITGNTIVAKPAPTTPLTTLLFGEMVAKLLPAGVLNIVVDQNDLGGLLTTHPDVAKVAFTGSTATGKKVMQSVSSTLKRLTLELGGNDAAIVLDDADIKSVASKIFNHAMSNAGQICLATKRVFVHSSIYDEFCAEMVRLAHEAVVDDGINPGTTIGPLQNKAQFEKVKGFLQDAHANGTILAGGMPLPRKGYFIEPTIVTAISIQSRLVREEQFGPVLPVLPYEDLEDAIAWTNDTDYGLGGSIWTSDVERGFQVASRIQSGSVWINKAHELPFDVPFRGAKQSGIGTENGQEGMEEYTQAKIINMAL